MLFWVNHVRVTSFRQISTFTGMCLLPHHPRTRPFVATASVSVSLHAGQVKSRTPVKTTGPEMSAVLGRGTVLPSRVRSRTSSVASTVLWSNGMSTSFHSGPNIMNPPAKPIPKQAAPAAIPSRISRQCSLMKYILSTSFRLVTVFFSPFARYKYFPCEHWDVHHQKELNLQGYLLRCWFHVHLLSAVCYKVRKVAYLVASQSRSGESLDLVSCLGAAQP